MLRRVLLALLPVLGAGPAGPGFLSRCGIGAAPDSVAILPDRLREVSGLVFTADGQLLAHDDERGVVYRLDPASGVVRQALPLLGAPRGDFEGIAELDGRVYLSTSRGLLFDLGTLPDSGPVRWRTIDPGIGDRCEFEGLGADPLADVLLLACKTPRGHRHQGQVLLYRWSPARPAVVAVDMITATLPSGEHFAPSSIDRDPVSGHYVLVTARDPRLLEITPAGALVGIRPLRPRFHHQTEGLAIAPGGRLYLSDEGGHGRATLSLYRCRR
jgi:hypothetical protein